MSTRSITTVRSRWDRKGEFATHANIYRHHDGYLSGHGAWLHEFFDGLAVVNGIGGKMPKRYVNGPGRLAAALVSKLHADGHDPALMENECNTGQEFHYVIDVEFGGAFVNETFLVIVTVYDGPVTFFGQGGENCTNKIFSGSVKEFGAFLKKDREDNA